MRGFRLVLATWLLHECRTAWGAGKKPLFEYDDHYVMLNDRGRNDYYRRALERALPACGPHCSVLDVGAGSGLLSIMAAGFGAKDVLAIEANPALAELAQQTIARNRDQKFPSSNVTVVAELSSRVVPEQLAGGRLADILVTETFGTMLLGEGALNFVPDARDRLLKPGGVMIPAGGCQYVTLVEVPALGEVMWPGWQSGFNLSRLELLQDTVYWKATMGASTVPFTALSERVCVLEVDLYKHSRDSFPENRTFRLQATRSGRVHAVLYDWDVWLDEQRSDLLSTAPGSRGFSGDVAWGWLMQLQEEAGEDWHFGDRPRPLLVQEGEWLELGVEFIARGISMHSRVRRAPAAGGAAVADNRMPRVSSPQRLRGVQRAEVLEANDFVLPVAGDAQRHAFYERGLRKAIEQQLAAITATAEASRRPTVLDCSSNGGVPALLAAKHFGLRALTLTHGSELARLLRKVAEDNGVEALMEAYASDPREFLEALLPDGEPADVVVVDPPGTPLHGQSPFALLPTIRKRLLRPGGVVVPPAACWSVALLESDDLAEMFAVPGGSWGGIDLTVWNEEAKRQRVLERLAPHTKWLGPHSTLRRKWLSRPQCVFHVDLNQYGSPAAAAVPQESTTPHLLRVVENGSAHALVGQWIVSDSDGGADSLGAADEYLGRSLTWPYYVQAVEAPISSGTGRLDPVPMRSGQQWRVDVTVRQGGAKLMGTAGPEFALRLHEVPLERAEL